MSEVRLVVREAERDWSGNIHGSCADRAIAALSADPTTLAELDAATARFAQPTPNRSFFVNLSPGLRDEPWDAGLVVIDLVARLIVVESTYSCPGTPGMVRYHNGNTSTDIQLWYHLADDWLISSDGNNWKCLADKRRRDRADCPVLDARAVLYGRPLLEFVAREIFAAFARRDTVAKSDQDEHASPFHEMAKEIHAAWLLTPRENLGGACPRKVALAQREHLSFDLQHRCDQWSSMGECPPVLDVSTFAYRYGGFGTHEMVTYYDMVRELLWSCWNRLVELEKLTASDQWLALTVGDFLATEIARLERVQEEWLDTPDTESHLGTPRSIIHRERIRQPEAVSPHDAIVDPDCPCCQMLSDLPGPMFWHLDGSEMDDGFAFDIYHQTREEWDEEQRRHEEFDRKFNAQWTERKQLGVTSSAAGDDGTPSIWTSSFSIGDLGEVPLGVRVFGIGCHLAELIVDLRGEAGGNSVPSEVQETIDQLNRQFGNLRELLQTPDESLAEALIQPVIDRFSEKLADVATSRSDLDGKCRSLTIAIAELLTPSQADRPSSGFDGDDWF